MKILSDLAKRAVQKLGSTADIRINGDRPWDIQVKDERCYPMILFHPNLGLGESYMKQWIECQQWDEFMDRILRTQATLKMEEKGGIYYRLQGFLANLRSLTEPFRVGKTHYDLGNDLFEKILDRRMTYSCGYWNTAKTLEEAQEAKLELVCKKLRLRPGMRILDIGCGWGSFIKYAAERYSVEAVGVTVSKEQFTLGKKLCKGLPVEIRLQDYREVHEPFDAVVSIGMFEHVCTMNYRAYMTLVHRNLKEEGLFLLQTIGNNESRGGVDPWIRKYIFPNSMVPSQVQIGKAIEGLFIMEDWHNFGSDYDKTLMAWYRNFEREKAFWVENYGERFYRMWKYYLLTCAGAFRGRALQLWQIVLSNKGVYGGYAPMR